jgi:hypothetical protein
VASSWIVNLPHQTRSGTLRSIPVVLMALVIFTPSLLATDDSDGLTVTALPITPDVEEIVAKDLDGYVPKSRGIQAGINKNGIYTLSGDLFDNGHIYAIIDSDSIVICEWVRHHWKADLQVNRKPIWRSPGWDKDGPGREPVATKPFWMLSVQRHPLLVIASLVEKAGQNYVIMLFDRRVRRIQDIAYSISAFNGTPAVRQEYLLTEDHSRVKAEWSETDFSHVEHYKFVVCGSWEEYVPYHQSDEGPTNTATSRKASFVIKQTDDQTANQTRFKIEKLTPDRRSSTWDAEICCTAAKADPDFYEEIFAYLFARLTGLPRSLYPTFAQSAPKRRLESNAAISVKGNKEVATLLSPTSR